MKDIKQWTVMIYMNAKNDLAGYAVEDINEMEMIGSTDKINVLVEYGLDLDKLKDHKPYPSKSKGLFDFNSDEEENSEEKHEYSSVKILYIKKDNDKFKVNSPVLLDLGQRDMGDYNTLAGFIKYAVERYPAKRYMLVLWNHGDGWFKNKSFDLNRRNNKGISFDDQTGNNITTPEIRLALTKGFKGKKLDILAYDACLMQMIEVAYELKDNVSFIVGSQEPTPLWGQDYVRVLAKLAENPYVSTSGYSKYLVDSFMNSYNINVDPEFMYYDIQSSVIKTSELEGLTPMIKDFVYRVAKKKGKLKTLTKVRKKVGFSGKHYGIVDICSFFELYRKYTEDKYEKDLSLKILDYIRKDVVYYNRVDNSKYNHDCGLTIYFTRRGSKDDEDTAAFKFNGYYELLWNRDTNWLKLIKWWGGKK